VVIFLVASRQPVVGRDGPAAPTGRTRGAGRRLDARFVLRSAVPCTGADLRR